MTMEKRAGGRPAERGFIAGITADAGLTWSPYEEKNTDDRPFQGELPEELLDDAERFFAGHGVRSVHHAAGDPGESLHDLGGALVYRFWDWDNERSDLRVLEPMPEAEWRAWLQRNSPLAERGAETDDFFGRVLAGFVKVSRFKSTTGATCVLRATDYDGDDEVRLWAMPDGSFRIDAQVGRRRHERVCASLDQMLAVYHHQLADHFGAQMRPEA